jgi:hypothetical protein
MQRYTVYLYLETAPHVLGGTSTHHQELRQLYLQNLVFVSPLLLPAAIAAGSSNGLDETTLQSHPNLHTKRSSIEGDIYQMSY